MTFARLPVPGEDNGRWGDLLNEFLLVEHNPNGSLKVRSLIAEKAQDSDVVHLSGVEVLSGPKTFSISPTIPSPTQSFHASNRAYVDTAVAPLADKANTADLATVATTGSYNDLTDLPAERGTDNFVEDDDPRLTNERTPTNDSVSTAKLQNESVTEAKLAISNIPVGGHMLAWNGSALEWQAPASAPVESVSGKTGEVTLVKADVGLSNVDNTSDADKPVSTATETALEDKLSLTGGTMTGSITMMGNVTETRHVATKLYVDNQVSGSQKLYVGEIEPAPPAGQSVLWVDTTGGNVTLNLVEGE
jgi:hypothetical protein